MKKTINLPIAGLALLLIGCLAGYLATRGNAPVRRESPALIDQRLLKTARQLAPLADTNDEQDQAREALRLADQELDIAFATALRAAVTGDAQNGGGTAQQRQLAGRIADLQAKIASGRNRVADLGKQGPTASGQLDLAKAQLELDQDDLDDAQQDMARAGGNLHARMERALQEHEAAQQAAAPLTKPGPLPPAETLKEQAQQWFSLKGKRAALVSAQEQANARVAELEREHNGLESRTGTAAPAGNPDDEDTAAAVAEMLKLSDQKKTLAELDKRIQDSQQLAAAYQSWSGLVETRQRATLHLVLQSLIEIFAILLVLVLAHRMVIHFIGDQDRRKRHRAQVASAITCQVVGVVVVLLIVFGPPTQLSTILGLATAGLTVGLKDFIVGFIGWFVLMGRNGVRIGDWVEINGVGGEVIEIGALKTTVLEVGNRSTGHPTGRRVSFSNSYAIEGHYFNFSTVGQWLWDELSVTVPPKGDPYQVAEQIRQTVERETEAAATEAEQDWSRVTSEYGVSSFSAKPAVDLRPGLTGLDVVVRYITRAPLRYEVKSRLFQAIVALLHTGTESQSS